MAIVNALRFNDYSGAVISDEETWLLRNRRAYICDNIHPILTPEQAEQWQMEVAYGGIGGPEFHSEVIANTRQQLSQGSRCKTVESVAQQVLQCMQAASLRRVNDRLTYLYGFTVDDFNRGYVERHGRKIEIKSEKIKRQALDIINGKDKGTASRAYGYRHAVIVGYDPCDGLAMFCLKAELGVLSFVSGGFEALGTGRYASAIAFAEYIHKRHVAQRRQGYERAEGMVALISSAIAAAENFNEIGGYFNIVYINGQAKTHAQRYQEIFHHRAHLATEIVLALRQNVLRTADAYDLIEALVFGGETEEKIEDALFQRAINPGALDLILRGYKVAHPSAVQRRPAPFISQNDSSAGTTKGSKTRRRK